jgi:hypothetical protein
LSLAASAEQRIFGLMGNTLAGGVQIVAATKGSKTVYWAAAVPRERAFLISGFNESLCAHHEISMI